MARIPEFWIVDLMTRVACWFRVAIRDGDTGTGSMAEDRASLPALLANVLVRRIVPGVTIQAASLFV